ncbi:ATPase [Aureococcus anophagefferens]|nr:ATPase [Aureococcus anophagefferens]
MPLAWNAGKIGVYQTHQHNSFVYKPPQPHRDQRENSCRANALFGKSLSERFAFHDTRRRKPRYPPQPTPSEMSLSCRAARRRDVRHFSTSLARQGSRENFGGAPVRSGSARELSARRYGAAVSARPSAATVLTMRDHSAREGAPRSAARRSRSGASPARGARPDVAVARAADDADVPAAGQRKPRAARVDGTPIPITRAFSTLLEAGKPRRRKKTRREAGMAWSYDYGWREKPRPAEPPARPSTAPAQVRPSTAP